MAIHSASSATGIDGTVAAGSRTRAAGRASGALHFWALLGVGSVALALHNWARWIASPDFSQPDPGPDPYPYMAILRATEFVSSAVFVLLLWVTLLGPLLRRRTITLDGKLFIGGF